MIMMVVTVKVAVEPLAVAVHPVQTVSLISHHTDLNAVIPLGMNMVLTVLIWKVTIIGIVQAVLVLVMVIAVQIAGLVMVLKIARITHGAVI